jgi:biotin-(acetyl-CoA carboxylase) ligase
VNHDFRNELDLPPGFRPVTLREAGDAFAHAAAHAAELGAGTLVFVGRFDLSEFAVVLEPDEPLSSARRAFYAGMVALADTLAAHAPPDKPIEFIWPDTMRVDGGIVGGGRLAWAKGPEDRAPDWLVFGAMVRTVALADGFAALHPLSTALEEEGFEGLESGRLAESFSRHLMSAVDAWQEKGFDAIARRYLPRLAPEKGASRSIDDNGDLLVRIAGKSGTERRALVPALAAPGWLDPQTRAPR